MAAVALTVLLALACSPVVSPSPTSTGSATGTATSGTPTPPATSPAATGDTIVVALSLPPFVPSPFYKLSNAFAFRPPIRADIGVQAIHSALYRYNERLEPVPDLAAEPCEIADDRVTIVCRLVEARFHDGTPLTADDVVFTYELARRHPGCVFGFGTCLRNLESVRAVDERTVEFRLSAPDATFLTLALPSVTIDSRAVVEAAYAPLRERLPTLDAADFAAVADEIEEQRSSAAPDCEAPIATAEPLFAEAGLEMLPRDGFAPTGAFDPCLYIEELRVIVGDMAESLQRDGLDALALAYRSLPFNWAPVGAGPWRFVSIENGTTLKLAAFEGYHRGPAATRRLEIRVERDFESIRDGLSRGEIHWVVANPSQVGELEEGPTARLVSYPESAFFVIAYNLREGMLFANRDLRTAVELCIDKAATVDAATNGLGDPIKSPIDPVSWAYDPAIPQLERDVDAARRLIEAAGWTEGEDGIYVRDGRRLATEVFVADDFEDRVRFIDLVAEQVRDCGIELTVVPADVATVLRPLERFPHIPGGRDRPFEAVFIAFGHAYDPHDPIWHSSTITTAEQPENLNFMGLDNERIDELLEAGVATYDQRERTQIYRELQQVFAEERPMLFAWAARGREAISPRLGVTDGELNFASRQWPWQLEKLVLRDAGR